MPKVSTIIALVIGWLVFTVHLYTWYVGDHPNDDGDHPNDDGDHPNDDGDHPNDDGDHPNKGDHPNDDGDLPNKGDHPNDDGDHPNKDDHPNDDGYTSRYEEGRRQRAPQRQHRRKLPAKRLCVESGALRTARLCLSNTSLVVDGNNLWSAKLCAGLEQLFGNTTVADLGAGLGHYGRCFLRRSEGILNHPNKTEIENINRDYLHQMDMAGLLGTPRVIHSWNGWDGAANIDEFTNGRIASADLSSPATLGGPFDWVMSLEVGEHIPESGEKNFLDNLVKHACVGVVMSWATQGQSCLNCRSNHYIKGKMGVRGLKLDMYETVKLRTLADLPRFNNTLMVFRFRTRRC